MRYIECPSEWDGHARAVFLAGGITNCPDWQGRMALMLADTSFVVLNPRRSVWPAGDIAEQVGWEYRHLKVADIVAFWFPAGPSACPISLYELGQATGRYATILVGIEAGYPRAADLRAQLPLAMGPGFRIAASLGELAEQIRRA